MPNTMRALFGHDPSQPKNNSYCFFLVELNIIQSVSQEEARESYIIDTWRFLGAL